MAWWQHAGILQARPAKGRNLGPWGPSWGLSRLPSSSRSSVKLAGKGDHMPDSPLSRQAWKTKSSPNQKLPLILLCLVKMQSNSRPCYQVEKKIIGKNKNPLLHIVNKTMTPLISRTVISVLLVSWVFFFPQAALLLGENGKRFDIPSTSLSPPQNHLPGKVWS